MFFKKTAATRASITNTLLLPDCWYPGLYITANTACFTIYNVDVTSFKIPCESFSILSSWDMMITVIIGGMHTEAAMDTQR